MSDQGNSMSDSGHPMPVGDPHKARAQMPVVTVRGITLGEGRPEVIVPLVGANETALLAHAEAVRAVPARIVEWRLDRYLPGAKPRAHRAAVADVATRVRHTVGPDRALLATFRTTTEGGAMPLSDADLTDLLATLIGLDEEQGAPLFDLVDVETARDTASVDGVMAAAHRRGIPVIGSFHDMTTTPPREKIVEVLHRQWDRGADIAKIAVTPRTAEDVLTLLAASLEAATSQRGPQITISMGSLGAVTRIAAQTFGSAATFATVGEGSAPGQLAAADVVRMLELLQP